MSRARRVAFVVAFCSTRCGSVDLIERGKVPLAKGYGIEEIVVSSIGPLDFT